MLVNDWLEVIKEAIELFQMADCKKAQCVSYLIIVDVKVWWQALRDTYWVDMMTWVKFRKAFERIFGS